MYLPIPSPPISQGDITENRELIEELELSKKISDDIAKKLDESKITSEKINITSEKYRPVSQRGTLLFFAMNSLYKMHTYYMFSLNSFIYFFLRGISTAGIVQEEVTKEGEEIDTMDEASVNEGSLDGGSSIGNESSVVGLFLYCM